ncbi:MAG: vanadium-dependent haloperoxidase [Verrucomicrobia bacterium]|nr:vanadium-dependent haloperoxidase [Cytophagales bacterium]
MLKNILFVLLFFSLLSCDKRVENYQQVASDPTYLHNAQQKLTDIMVHDIFSPPVASRIYMYANVAAYEALIPQYSDYQSLANQIRDLTPSPKPDPNQEYCFPLASLKAYLSVGKTLTFSLDTLNDYENKLYKHFKDILPDEIYNCSLVFGEKIANHILDFSKKDNYKQTRGFRYTLSGKAGEWSPTPPAYADAVEPKWMTIRPLALDSAGQFLPPRPPVFSKDKKSEFYKEVLEVYEMGKKLTDEQKHIASFWDCNPFKVNIVGHVMYATKKISPGGHWICIAGDVSKKANLDLMKTTETYALVSIGLFDGFITCWDEKYRSVKVRPETYINEFDSNWQPLLQTPPFPEYPSGHSVVSSASAVILTHLLGNKFSFTDSTEVRYQIPARSYQSFQQAADEASMSRLYGGIHYRSGIEHGATMGRKVGELVLQKVQTRKQTVVKKF